MIHEGIRPECFCRAKHDKNLLESVGSNSVDRTPSGDYSTTLCRVNTIDDKVFK